MRIGFYQFSSHFGQVPTNIQQMAAALSRAEADLVVFPELATSGYLFVCREEVAAMAETIPGPTTDYMEKIARQQRCSIVLGMPERHGEHFYNSAVLIGPQGVVGVYRKVHLFFEEKLYFEPGDRGFPVFELAGVKIGLLVCFDHMFPEAARALALQGAQVICHPSNLVLPEYGQLTTRVRALENRVYWILANRCGVEERGGKKLVYTGCSQVVAPNGTMLATASARDHALEIVEIDASQACHKKVTSFNDLFEDRRPELYGI